MKDLQDIERFAALSRKHLRAYREVQGVPADVKARYIEQVALQIVNAEAEIRRRAN